MQILSTSQVCEVSGGFSEKTMLSVRGGVLGGTEGAVIGGILSVPLWSMAISYGGSALAIGCLALGMGAGTLVGAALGVCAGYTLYYCW